MSQNSIFSEKTKTNNPIKKREAHLAPLPQDQNPTKVKEQNLQKGSVKIFFKGWGFGLWLIKLKTKTPSVRIKARGPKHK